MQHYLWVATRGDDWHDIVAKYSHRALTLPQDRLIALAGVAARFALRQDTPSRYLAGLWEDSLPQNLLWQTFASVSSNGYIAPSWSWACGNCYVLNQIQEDDVPRCSLIQAWTNAPDGLYGAVTEGYIILKGPLISTVMLSTDVDSRGDLEFKNGLTTREWTTRDGSKERYLYPYIGVDNPKNFKHRSKVFMAAMCTDHIRISPTLSESQKFLVLQQVDGVARGTFRRIGTAIFGMDYAIDIYLWALCSGHPAFKQSSPLQEDRSAQLDTWCSQLLGYEVIYARKWGLTEEDQHGAEGSKTSMEEDGNAAAEDKGHNMKTVSLNLDEGENKVVHEEQRRLLHEKLKLPHPMLNEEEYLKYDTESGHYTYKII